MDDDNDIDITLGMEEVEFEDWEAVYFTGSCTCDHEEEKHGWGSCDYDGCTCQAGWEE